MRYIHVDIPHYVIVLFIFVVLIIQNRSYTIELLSMQHIGISVSSKTIYCVMYLGNKYNSSFQQSLKTRRFVYDMTIYAILGFNYEKQN